MADMFSKWDAINLLGHKRLFLFGDSNMRALYKDILYLINEGTFIDNKSLRGKLESNYMNDKLTMKSHLHAGRDFREERKYDINNIHVEFKFITRCWCNIIENFLEDCKRNIIRPDVIIMNSCLWDICRWGPNGVDDYKDNMLKLLKQFRRALPRDCIVIWTSTLPVASKCRAAFLVEQVDFLKHSLHFDIMEANVLARDLVVTHGFDVLDVYHYIRMQTVLRNKDGIHWISSAMRLITNLILTHIALSLNHELPGRIKNSALTRSINMNIEEHPARIVQALKVPVEIKESKREAPSRACKIKSLASRVERAKPYHRSNDNHHSNNNHGNNNHYNNYNDFTKDDFKNYDGYYRFDEEHSSRQTYDSNYDKYNNCGPMRRHRGRRF